MIIFLSLAIVLFLAVIGWIVWVTLEPVRCVVCHHWLRERHGVRWTGREGETFWTHSGACEIKYGEDFRATEVSAATLPGASTGRTSVWMV